MDVVKIPPHTFGGARYMTGEEKKMLSEAKELLSDKEWALESLRKSLIGKLETANEEELRDFCGCGPFITGHGGKKNDEGFPNTVTICNTIGSDLIAVYKRIDSE